MDKLDPLLSDDLNNAIERAKHLGRFEIADYLSLRASNDQLRSEAVKWLFETVLEIVSAFNRHGARIIVDQNDDCRIKYGPYRLSGSLIELKQGLRCLTVEAGWTRRMDDGIIRGGSLAYSRISHFGMARQTEELVLHEFEGKPQWFIVRDEKTRETFNVSSLRKHFEVFLG